MPIKYKMRAYKTTAPVGYVFWDAINEPDYDGSQSIYNPSDLVRITVTNEYEYSVPLSGDEFSVLLEGSNDTLSYQRLTADMILPAFIVNLLPDGEYAELGQSFNNKPFTVTYSGGSPTSAVLVSKRSTDLTNQETINLSGPSYNSVSSTINYTFNNISDFGKYITYTLTAITATTGPSGKYDISQYTFLLRNYWGASVNDSITNPNSLDGMVSVISSTNTNIFTIEVTDKYIYYIYAYIHGASSTSDDFIVNGFPGGWVLVSNSSSFVNGYGFTTTYYVYRTLNKVNGKFNIEVK